MAFFARTAGGALFALALTASIGACGHSALDLFPEDVDGGGGVGTADGGLDAEVDVDVMPADAGVDAGCTGPSCPGTYVAGDVGSDTNPGTGFAPVKTIKKAMEIAALLGGAQDVYVAAAKYTEKVTLAERVSLLGGYDCSALPCTWARDIATKESTLVAPDFDGVFAPHTITRKTLFEGFRVDGKAGTPVAVPGGAAMTLEGSPTIARCTIRGGDTTGGIVNARRSIGISVLAPSSDPAGARIVDNTIGAGTAAEESVGVHFQGRAAAVGSVSATLAKNRIQGGNAPSSIGIAAWSSGAGTVIRDNDILAGTSTTGGGGAWGIAVGSTMTIDGNRINVDANAPGSCIQTVAPNFCGGIVSLSSTSVITNNIIRGVKGPRSCAVALVEAEKVAGAVVLNGNTLDGGGSGPTVGLVSAAVTVRTGVGTNSIFGNVRNNILLGGSNKSRYGVFEDSVAGKTARPAVLENNDFWNPPLASPTSDFAYRQWVAGVGTDVPFANLTTKLTALAPKDNLGVDPLFGTGFHLQTTSPVIDEGTPTEAPPRDMDGNARPQGAAVDMGADEAR